MCTECKDVFAAACFHNSSPQFFLNMRGVLKYKLNYRDIPA